jgi:PAS domain S-box-containing protein
MKVVRIGVLITFSLILFAGCTPEGSEKNAPTAIKGILDLRNYSHSENTVINLKGEWEFYWQDFIDPADTAGPRKLKDKSFALVPGTWNGYSWKGEKLPGHGYASYRLTVLLPEVSGPLTFSLLDAGTCLTFFVNGENIYSSGEPGTTKETSKPGSNPGFVNIPVTSTMLEIVVHVSNFHHRLGGLWEPIKLRTWAVVRTTRVRTRFFDSFLVGSIFLMSLYHLGLFVIRKKQVATAYFSAFCMLIVVRTLSVGQSMIMELVPAISFEMLMKMEYLSLVLTVPIFSLYLSSVIPYEFNRTIVHIISTIGGAFTLFVAIFPVSIYSYVTIPYQLFIVVAFLYGFFVIGHAIVRKREGVGFIAAGMLLFFITVINDILYTRLIIESTNLVPLGLFLFIFTQALYIYYIFSHSFKTIERQGDELKTQFAERKQVENALVNAYQIINQSPAVGFLWKNDEVWTVEFVSENVKSIFGYSTDELMSQKIRYSDIIYPEDIARVSREVESFSDDKSRSDFIHRPYRITVKGGETRWVLDRTYVQRDMSGEVTHFQGIVEDITERMEIDEELAGYRDHLEELVETRTKDVEASKKEAEAANRAKSEFLTNMSHELRTPLNHIIGFSDILLDKRFGNLTDSQEEYLGDVLYSSKHLLSLINDMLDLARIEARKEKIAITLVNLEELIESSIGSFKEQAGAKSIDFASNFSNLPATIKTDELKLKQILFNLISNAVKFTPQGGHIEISGEGSTESDQDPKKTVRLCVKDSGIGLNSEDLDRIFIPFEQVDGSRSRKYKGTGIGLSLTKKLAELIGGKLWVESEGEGKGSEFWLTLPYAFEYSGEGT